MHLFLFMSILLTASAAYVPHIDPCLKEVQDQENVELDGVTNDGTAGIGAEFESPEFYFVKRECSPEDTFAATGKIIAGRQGTNWMLTADTVPTPGKLNAEYILDGRNIKVGAGNAKKAGAAIAKDLVSSAASRLRVLSC